MSEVTGVWHFRRKSGVLQIWYQSQVASNGFKILGLLLGLRIFFIKKCFKLLSYFKNIFNQNEILKYYFKILSKLEFEIKNVNI